MHHPPTSVKDTIPASSPKARTPRHDAAQPKSAHMLACRQLLGIATLALRCLSPCCACLIFPHKQEILLTGIPPKRWHNDCSSCWCTRRKLQRCLGHAISGRERQSLRTQSTLHGGVP